MNASISYSPILVILSIVIAMQAGYVGIKLAIEVPGAFAIRRRGLIAGSAATLAVGIWSMHFIGMLAVRTAVAIDYAVLPTLLSFLICGLVTGVAIYLASLRAQRLIGVAAVVMGLGITTMHYVGMIAVHSVLGLSHDPAYGLASVMIAVAASGLALWLAFSADRRPPLYLCAVMFGCAVSGMHYIAMAGTTAHLMQMPATEPAMKPILSGDMLAIVVSVVACVISAVFMLALIPKEDVRLDSAAATDADLGETASGKMSDGKTADGEAPRHDSMPPIDAPSAEALPAETMPTPAILLPIEKNDNRFHVAADQIVSVHSTAHYTYIFNGRDDLFCPLSITEKAAEALVEPRTLLIHFLREQQNLTGAHIGCDTGHCGACTVDMDEMSVKTCMTFAVQANGAKITTIEGVANPDGTLSALQEGFRMMHGLQCGYCTPGMILRAHRLLQENPDPSEDEIRTGIAGNLCRCTGYMNIVKSIQYAAAKINGTSYQEAAE